MPAGKLTLQVAGAKTTKGQTKAMRKASKNSKAFSKVFVAQKSKPTITRSPFGNGFHKFCALKYVIAQGLTSTATANLIGTEIAFRLNSLTLPMVGQAVGFPLPQGLTSLVNNYSNYKVYGAKVKIEFFDPQGEDVRAVVKYDTSGDGQGVGGATVQAAAMKYGTFIRSISNDSGSQKASVSFYLPIAKLEGLTKSQFDANNSQYEGYITQSLALATIDELTPTAGYLVKRRPQVHIGLASTSNTVAQCQAIITIIYYTRIYGRISLPYGQSA